MNTVRYWIYRGLKGGGFSRRVKGIIFTELEDAQAYVKEQSERSANSEYDIIEKIYTRRNKQ